MKTLLIVSIVTLTSSFAFGQAIPPSVVERGPHHALHHWTTEQLWPDGQSRTEDHYVTELTTGLNYFQENQWIPSKEEIELFQGGALARQGQFQVIFGPNLNVAGAVDLLTPDGQRFSSRIMGLIYLDSSSGESVLIAETKDSQGQVLPPNQVFYLDAFDGVDADVRYTYKKGSFEQDIILRAKPQPPSAYGLSDEFSRIEVWTEFFDSPTPVKQSVVLREETDPVRRQAMAVPDFVDHRLDFIRVQIGSGKAFLVADDSEEALPVAKDWGTVQEPGGPARTFLIESVEFPAIAPWLNTLPGGQAAVNPANPPGVRLARKPAASRSGLLAQARPVPTKLNAAPKLQMAKVDFNPQLAALSRRPGVVIDYITLNSSQTNQIFYADSTFNISGPVNLYGTSNRLEGGTILKFSQGAGATINVKGTLLGDTDIYRPAVLTASADGTVGESLGGSLSGYYATTALEFDYATSSQLATQQNLRILYAVVGVRFNGGSGHQLRHLQLVNCGTAVKADNSQYAIRNALGWNLTNALVGSSSTGAWEHATFNGVTNLVTSITGRFTNCLLTAIVATNGLTGASNIVLSSASGVFKTVGSGYHYLTNGSPYRDLGTTNINPTLAGELRKRTTYPPIVLGAITADTTLTPQAGRDTDLPDVGWHYSPLDYFASGVVVSSNVTLSLNNSVAVGMDYSGGNSWGFDLRNARFISTGKAEQFNYVGRAHTVQEKSNGNPGTRACFYDGASSSGSRECALRLRFTEFSQLQNDGYMLYVGTKFGALEWTHSRVYNPSVIIDTSGNGVMVCGMTNTLWERGFVQVGAGSTSGTNVTAHLRNNLARNIASWHFLRGSNSWTVRDNLFDSVTVLTNNGSVVQNWTNAYFNMFWGLTSGIGNTNLASLTYEVGPLGKYYQPANSSLTNAGTRTADLAQLYHFTTATNQVKETNSFVDIGLHYVAVNASGQPLDFDTDGTPDYLEDADGDGAVDNGETNWEDPLDWGLRVFITRPRNGGNIP